ncbi:MAG: DUF2061 domain-containing protein [Crocinitomicaceae bacterium]
MLIDTLVKRQNDTRVSLLKTISWRVIGTLDTMLISYILTGELSLAVSIGSVEVVSKMILYYLHERAWIKLLKR